MKGNKMSWRLELLLLLLVLMVMDGWVVGFAGHFGGLFLKIS
jgi:hypothetical protein